MRAIILLGLVALIGAADAAKYSGAQVLRVTLQEERYVWGMKHLENTGEYDFFKRSAVVGDYVEIMAKVDQVANLKAYLDASKIEYEVKISDLQPVIDESYRSNERAREEYGPRMDWVSYHTWDEINDWVDELGVNYSSIVTVSQFGTTYEGKPMKLATFSTGGTGKPKLVVEGTIHAREWASPATVTYFMNELVNTASPEYGLLANYDIYVMPMINIDGYAHTQTDRLWRKTRSPNDGSACIGKDPNRNFDYQWGGAGTSDSACSEIYRGPSAFSEVETKSESDLILSLSNVQAVFCIHSYGEYILYPFGYLNTGPPASNAGDLDAVGDAGVAAIIATTGNRNFVVGNSGSLLGAAAGAADDWARGSANIEYAYTLELRSGGQGFELPENEILPCAQEISAALVAMAKEMLVR